MQSRDKRDLAASGGTGPGSLGKAALCSQTASVPSLIRYRLYRDSTLHFHYNFPFIFCIFFVFFLFIFVLEPLSKYIFKVTENI